MSSLMANIERRNINSIIAENSGKLLGFIRSRVRNVSDAEDILQDVWGQLSNIVDLDSIEQISSWLYRVARNRITDTYRKKKPELIIDVPSDDNSGIGIQEIIAELPMVEDEEMKEIFWNQLFVALDELPEDQKNAFVWNELEDQTFQEIADRTGIGIKTWISRKGYAVKHLRSRMKLVYEEFFELD